MDFPHTDDPLVQALQRLVRRMNGWAAVAAGGPINDQTIYQIVMRKVDSKTKKPKGVGPKVRRFLDATYPDWLKPETPPRDDCPIDMAVNVVLGALGKLTAGQWKMIRARLDDMPEHPEMLEDVANDVLHLLMATSGKRQANGA